MDAVHFGRWISERRRAYGWPSQRALADTANQNQDPIIGESGISEDFLARLEAGRLAHPFRGIARRRILALAWLLCKSPRDVRTYLRAAELTELTASEIEQMNCLRQELSTEASVGSPSGSTELLPTTLHLPPHPLRLLGRVSVMHRLINVILDAADIGGVCSITGMPGVGKSALAYEALHLLTASEENEREGLHRFPHGIAAFTCTGRRGIGGLIALLNEITEAFTPGGARRKQTAPLPESGVEADLAGAIHRTRAALAGKHVLILLDDLDAQFPLHLALEGLLAHDLIHNGGHNKHTTALHRVILTTSRYIPSPTLTTAAHIHLEPLEAEASLDLLTVLLQRGGIMQPINSHTARVHAQQICAAIGHLPLAIELAATAIAIKGIPLALLAAHLVEGQRQALGLSDLLDSENMLRSTFDRALAALDPIMRQRFILLFAAMSGRSTFDLEYATTILHAPARGVREIYEQKASGSFSGHYATHDISLAQLASTAADLGQFVRHSLLELEPYDPSLAYEEERSRSSYRYRLHPLLQTYSIDTLHRESGLEATQKLLQMQQLSHAPFVHTPAYANEFHQEKLLPQESRREFQFSGAIRD